MCLESEEEEEDERMEETERELSGIGVDWTARGGYRRGGRGKLASVLVYVAYSIIPEWCHGNRLRPQCDWSVALCTNTVC